MLSAAKTSSLHLIWEDLFTPSLWYFLNDSQSWTWWLNTSNQSNHFDCYSIETIRSKHSQQSFYFRMNNYIRPGVRKVTRRQCEFESWSLFLDFQSLFLKKTENWTVFNGALSKRSLKQRIGLNDHGDQY